MKLIFAVLDVSLTTGLTRCYKTEGFLHLYLVSNDVNATFCDGGIHFDSVAHLCISKLMR